MAELNFDVNLNDNQYAKGANPNLYPTFNHNAGDQYNNGGAPQQGLYPNVNQPGQSNQPAAQAPSKVPLLGFFSIEFYQPYFNVTTKDVQDRIKSSINPFKPRFFELTQDNADLYGPVWIYTTLVLVLAAAGNFSQLVNSSKKTHIDYNFVPSAALLIYGYGFVFPIILTVLLKIFGSNSSSYVQTICCYGYSLSVFIPIFILTAIPVGILQWILMAYGIASSTLFLITNYGHELKKFVGQQRYILLGFIGVAQVALMLIFKLYFFKTVYEGAELDNKADTL